MKKQKLEPLLKEEQETFPWLEEKKESKKIKIDKSLIITIIIAIFVVLWFGRSVYGFYIGFKYYDLRYDDITLEEEKTNDSGEEEIDINSLVLSEVYGSIDITDTNELANLYPIFYSENELLAHNLNDMQKLSLIFSYLGIDCNNLEGNLTIDDIKAGAILLFNDDTFLNILLDQNELSIDNYKILKEENIYKVSIDTCINSSNITKTITKASTKDDELYIYEKVNNIDYKWTYKKGDSNNYYFVAIVPL